MTHGPEASELTAALRRLRGAFLAVGAFSGCLNLLMLAPSLYMLQVYDRVLSSRNETTLVVLTLLLLMAYALAGGLEAIRTWVLVRVGARLDTDLHGRVFRATFDRSLERPGSSAVQPVQDLNTLRQTLTGPGLLTLFDAPWLPVYLVVIALMSVELAAFAGLGALVLAVLAVLNERVVKKRLDDAQRCSMQAQNALAHPFRHAEVIEAMGMLTAVHRRWHGWHREQLQHQADASDRAAVVNAITRFVRLLMQSLALGLGALLVLEDRMSPGSMIAASVLVSRALSPVEMLIGNWKQIVSGRAAFRRLAALLTAHPAHRPAMPLQPPRGELRVEGASVAPPGSDQVVLKGLSFAVEPGDCVAVIGPSGSGKSTLARVLCGIWPARTGTVRLDGADLNQWSREELGPSIGYLPQDIELFDGTVAENIARLGAVDSERVITAAVRAGLHDTILRLPRGYDTPLGLAGTALSAGQRQRIGLARALYGDPAVVVLDEPNSNLDEPGERALVEAVRTLTARGATVILVTHRVTTLEVAQKLMVLNDGSLRAYGPRDEVLAALRAGATHAVPARA